MHMTPVMALMTKEQWERRFDEGFVGEKLEVNRGAAGDEADEKREQTNGAEDVHRLLGVTVEKLHDDQVAEHLEHALKAVFRLAAGAGEVIDRDFGDLRAVPAGVDREKAVHFAVKPDGLDDIGAVGLERAAEVVQFAPRKRRR